MSKLALAWAAGFFDGEGCICLHKHPKSNGKVDYELKLVIAQINIKPILKFKTLLGGNLRTREPGVYEWYCSSTEAIRILKLLLPYLVLKDTQAKYGIKYENVMVGKGKKATSVQIKQKEFLFKKLRDLKDRRNIFRKHN